MIPDWNLKLVYWPNRRLLQASQDQEVTVYVTRTGKNTTVLAVGIYQKARYL